VLISSLRSVSSLVLLAVDDSDQKPTFEQTIKKQIEALRKQLDETEKAPSVLRYALTEPMPCESQLPPQVHSSKVPKKEKEDEIESYKQDIQSRAKAAAAYGRSFIA